MSYYWLTDRIAKEVTTIVFTCTAVFTVNIILVYMYVTALTATATIKVLHVYTFEVNSKGK